jgi:hypothetical protein
MATGLTKLQIEQLMNDKGIQATIEANKIKAEKSRDADLMMLGYNQALLDVGQAALPEGWTVEDLQVVINKQREKLGV